ncbi:hypothetical protein OAF21_09225 [Akkermansiaceae bacterium]|nr:hypothetical protein [Akkermansiaceae bacterium]
MQHIQDALDHLFDPQQQQQPQQGEGDPGDGEPSEGEDEGPEGDRPDGEDEGEDEGNKGDSDADLRRSEKEDGDLRGRLLRELSDQLSRENRGKPRVDDH